jgi:hypothetical protein
MTDGEFVSILNEVAQMQTLHLSDMKPDAAPSSEFLSRWAHFLEALVREGVSLSDPRWGRLAVESDKPCTRFALAEPGHTVSQGDSDFRVGLQLLMGLLGKTTDPEA